MQIQNRLATMVGKFFLVNGSEHKVCAWTIIDEINSVLIGTDKEIIRLDIDKAEKHILSNFLECEPDSADKLALKTPVNDLISTLMENIKKVQVDPTFIKQAQATNGTVNTIGNLMKLKILYDKKD